MLFPHGVAVKWYSVRLTVTRFLVQYPAGAVNSEVIRDQKFKSTKKYRKSKKYTFVFECRLDARKVLKISSGISEVKPKIKLKLHFEHKLQKQVGFVTFKVY